MTLEQIYQLAINLGIKSGPRGKERIKKILAREKEKYEKLSKEEKELFDQEKLTNPFSDTRILFGSPNTKIKTILAGIDIGVGEVLLADCLRQKGKEVDLLLSHHPVGKALAGLDGVIALQADLFADYGVPINIAESLLEKRVGEVARSVSPINHNQAVDVARLLDIPFLCAHTAVDNLVFNFLKKELKKKKSKLETVGDVLGWLKTIPEYKEAVLLGAGPKIFAGQESRRTGRIALTEVTGGTEAGKGIYEKLAQAGIGTLIGMHMNEENKKEAEKHHINVIIAGHIASDSLGLNLFLDELEKKGIKIIPCSGLIRIKRK